MGEGSRLIDGLLAENDQAGEVSLPVGQSIISLLPSPFCLSNQAPLLLLILKAIADPTYSNRANFLLPLRPICLTMPGNDTS